MGSDGRERGGDRTDDNVVLFPRDWLGPRSELVPFGPRADAGPSQADERRSAKADLTDASTVIELPRPTAVTQDDFWSGDLEAIPRPVVVPVDASPFIADEPPSMERTSEPDEAGPTPADVAATNAPGAIAWGGRINAAWRRAPIGRAALALIVLIASAAAGASLIAAGGERQRPRPVPEPRASALPSFSQSLTWPVLPASHNARAAARRRANRPASHRAKKHAPRVSAPAISASPTSVATTASTGAASAPATASAYAAGGYGSYTASGTAQQTSVGASGRSFPASPAPSHTGSTKSGPIGPGAAFGPGHLG